MVYIHLCRGIKDYFNQIVIRASGGDTYAQLNCYGISESLLTRYCYNLVFTQFHRHKRRLWNKSTCYTFCFAMLMWYVFSNTILSEIIFAPTVTIFRPVSSRLDLHLFSARA